MTMESKMQQSAGGNVGHQQHGQGQMNSTAPKTIPGHGVGAAGSQTQTAGGPKLFVTTMLEPRDDLDDRHGRCHHLVVSLMAEKSDKEAHDALSSAVSKDPKTHEDVCIGFLVAILGHQPTGTNAASGINGSAVTVDQELAARYYRDLTLVARDGLQCVLAHLTHLAIEKFPKMYPCVKQQLMWLIRELIRNNVTGMDTVCWNLMRQIAGGDVSRNNLWLADIMIDIFSEHRAWLDKHSFLVASVTYTFLRLIEDHTQQHHEKLRDKEVCFVIGLIRDRFNDVLVIGRDLLRLLQYVAKIPEFEALWRDILYNPRSLSPTFSGFSQLMQTRTSRRFLQSRITPEMEKKLVFFTSQVRFGTHKRYQDWFQRQYLFTTESQSLRCDIIRFIVGVIHPTNELLCSDIIPRWAVIGWLLTTCTSQVAGSNAKLALFYDWLFFEPEKDNIMNIEPAILVMHHSMRPHPAITATLLDFLCRIIVNFTVGREQEKVRAGIYNSLKQILDKRVLPSLSPLFDNLRLDKELRCMLRERFAPFCSKDLEDASPTQPHPPLSVAAVSNQSVDTNPVMAGHTLGILEGIATKDDSNRDEDDGDPHEGENDDVAQFSDDEEQDARNIKHKSNAVQNKCASNLEILGKKCASNIATTVSSTSGAGSKHKLQGISSNSNVIGGKPQQKESASKRLKTDTKINSDVSSNSMPNRGSTNINRPTVQNIATLKSENERVNIFNQKMKQENEEEDDDVLDEDIKDILNDLKSPTADCEKKCEIMDQLVKHVTSEELDYEQCSALASNLAEILQEQFEGHIFPETPTEESVEDSIGKPLFVIFRALYEMTDSDPHRVHILQLLAELYTLQPRLGYYLLYFLNANNRQNAMMESVSANKSKSNEYRDLCEAIDQKYSLDICLVNDMRQCQEDDVNLFVYLLPDIYRNFPKHAVGNVDLLYLVVSCVDGKQVQTLVCHVVARDFIMFKKDSVQAVLTASLGWETFEQYALWQLISAHDLPFDCVLPMVPKLSAIRHSEALTSVLLRIRQERPTAELLKHLMAREVNLEDRFVSSCLVNWMHEYEDKLGDLLCSHLSKASSGSSSVKTDVGSKRKRGSQNMKNGVLSHSAELTLSHLDQLRHTCTQYDFFEQRGIQSTLQQVRHSCTESQKNKFMDLFALADLDSEDETPPVKSKSGNVLSKGGDRGSGSGSGGGGKSNSSNSSALTTSKASPAKPSSKSSSRHSHHHSSHGGSHHVHHSSSTVQKTESSSSVSSKKLEQSDSSDASSESDEEIEKPLKSSKNKSNRVGSNKSSGNTSNKSLNNPRKRGKISYKEMESTDESSDEDMMNDKPKITPKKRKKVVQSDSD